MARKTYLNVFNVFLMPENEWRAEMEVFSKFRKAENSKDDENFRGYINLPIKSGDTSPAEIKKETLIKLRDTFIEVIEWLKKQTE